MTIVEKRAADIKIKCEQIISFPEAPKYNEQFNGAKTYASAVKPGSCNKTTQTENKNTKTDESITEYKKQTQTKTQEDPQDKKQGKENSPRPGPALKQATIGMMKKDEEKKKKEDKNKLKKQQKEERRQQYLK